VLIIVWATLIVPRIVCDLKRGKLECIADDTKSRCTPRSGREQHFVTGRFAKAVLTPKLRSTRRIEWPIKNKKSSRCGRSLLTKWAFRSVSLFPVILRDYGAGHHCDNALHKNRNEYKNGVVPGKSNRDRYESKEKSLTRLSEIMVVNIKMDDHITLNTFPLHFSTYMCIVDLKCETILLHQYLIIYRALCDNDRKKFAEICYIMF